MNMAQLTSNRPYCKPTTASNNLQISCEPALKLQSGRKQSYKIIIKNEHKSFLTHSKTRQRPALGPFLDGGLNLGCSKDSYSYQQGSRNQKTFCLAGPIRKVWLYLGEEKIKFQYLRISKKLMMESCTHSQVSYLWFRWNLFS